MLIKLVRIGRDAELRSANGKPVLSVSVVYDIGYGQNKKPQWLNLTMWGQQAEKVQPYFTKGKQIVIRADDINWRWGSAFLIAFLSLSVVASLGTMLSTIMDNSITPIVTVMATIIIFTIIGMFDMKSFDLIKPFLFTTHMISWRSLFEDPIPLNTILFSCGVLFLHIIIFLGIAIYYFKRKDITT